jgi:ABC-type sugar transport system ATPase subunit
MKKEILRMDHVITDDSSKTNLNNFSLRMFAGEITGLIGVNEHGKEKLIELICKNTVIKFGRIYFMENLVNNYKFSSETENKVYVLNHISKLIGDLSVIDNVFVLRKGFKKSVISKRVLDIQMIQLQKEFGIHINPRELCKNLTGYERCVVEILKAIVQGVKLFILNGISDGMSIRNLEKFHKLLFLLVEQGYSILYIASHHEEVFPISHRAALMKDGKIIKMFEKDEMNDESILPYTISFEDSKKENSKNGNKSKVSFCNITSEYLKGLSFDMNEGECVILYDRNKKLQQDITRSFCGEKRLSDGFIKIGDKKLEESKRGRKWFSQIAFIDENAVESMVFYDLSYIDNLCILLDNKSNGMNISERVKKSIRMEYAKELGEELLENNLWKLDKTSLYNLIYYRVHVLNPRIVFIVQPFSNADMYVRHHIIHLIRELKRKGIVVIILAITVSDTLYVADKFILIEDGKKKEEYLSDSFRDISFYI